MSDQLSELEVLALDCQAAGATPAYGDLLELGWAVCAGASSVGPVQSHWIVPRTQRPISKAVRELTGWTEACVADAVPERDAWHALRADIARIAGQSGAAAPTVIHFARFELGFLRDVHERLGEADDFPLDAVCLHAIARRLFPDLPRRSIRALAGHLGHSPDLLRRSAGHVEASIFIWQAVVPLLEAAGVGTWDELKAWLAEASPYTRPKRWVYPLDPERRRGLPDQPGVYRFLRKSGDVLYVGKATSLKKRVAGHFKGRGRTTERALELLTQVHDIHHTLVPSILEAALLESDEIKRLDPPYNVQLRSGERNAWFASHDFGEAVPRPDAGHRIGPLPSERALVPLAALIALASGETPTAQLLASALFVPTAFVPDLELFSEGWRIFSAEHLEEAEPSVARRMVGASRALWLERGRAESDSTEDAPPDSWDLARVRRRLERSLVQAGLLVRRARWLCLLVDSSIGFRERTMQTARGLDICRGEIVDRHDLESVTAIALLSGRRPASHTERQLAFDAATYDRMRVLVTELRRVHDEGGELALRVGTHTLTGKRLERMMREV